MSGDFSADQSLAANAGRVVAGLVPVYGQLADLRDLSSAGINLVRGRDGAFAELGMAAVGFIPVVGDGAKAALRARVGLQAAESGVNAATLRRSDHAFLRGQQGRPVTEAIADVRRAAASDFFVQLDGRVVVRGRNGREHIIEPNGEIVTSMVRSNAAHLQRVDRGAIEPAPSETVEQLRSMVP